MSIEIVTISERPALKERLAELDLAAWPKFMMQDPVEQKYWDRLLDTFAELQVAICDQGGKAIAAGYMVPIFWDETIEGLPLGWDDALERGVCEYDPNNLPNTISALSVVVHPQYRGKGLSKLVIGHMRALAEEGRFENIIVPVRPSQKSYYPLIPIERYVLWRQSGDWPFDPWLRTHAKLGAKFLKIARKSMTVPGTVAEWEEWAGCPEECQSTRLNPPFSFFFAYEYSQGRLRKALYHGLRLSRSHAPVV